MKTTELIKRTCPMCGRTTGLKEDETMAAEHRHYAMYGGRIQDELTDFDAFEREFVKTGYCPKCQEIIFGKEAPETGRFINMEATPEFWQSLHGLVVEMGRNTKAIIDSAKFKAFSADEKIITLSELMILPGYAVEDDGTVICARKWYAADIKWSVIDVMTGKDYTEKYLSVLPSETEIPQEFVNHYINSGRMEDAYKSVKLWLENLNGFIGTIESFSIEYRKQEKNIMDNYRRVDRIRALCKQIYRNKRRG